MRFEGRPLTEKEREFAISKAPEGTTLIVRGIMDAIYPKGHWYGCLRFFDDNYKVLKEMPWR